MMSKRWMTLALEYVATRFYLRLRRAFFPTGICLTPPYHRCCITSGGLRRIDELAFDAVTEPLSKLDL